MVERKEYEVTVEEVYSGDDFILMVDLGVSGLHKRVRCRLLGVDTPSAYKASKNTEAGLVRDSVRELIAKGKCSIELRTEGKGGWVVVLHVQDGERRVCVNDELIARGYIYTPTHKGQQHDQS